MKFVALGGGHGLAATLRALRQISGDLTAVVGVSDNGGSSGRLREEFGVLPPGDLRMALTALCDERETEWADLLQYRFEGSGALAGHSVGNLLITALWQSRNDVVGGLDAVCKLLNTQGRVLPLAITPIDLIAEAETESGEIVEVVGQVEIATTSHRVRNVKFDYAQVQACPQTLHAVREAEVLIMGPGSWFSSVLTHLSIKEVAEEFRNSRATKILVLNLVSQSGETEGFSPAEHLLALNKTNPDISFDFVVVDKHLVSTDLLTLSDSLNFRLISAELAEAANPAKHNPTALAAAIRECIESVERK